jgi:hypothetical protein
MWDGISASWAIEHDLERSKTFAADAYVICSRAKNERPEKWMRPQSGTHPMFTLEMRERQETVPIPPPGPSGVIWNDCLETLSMIASLCGVPRCIFQ